MSGRSRAGGKNMACSADGRRQRGAASARQARQTRQMALRLDAARPKRPRRSPRRAAGRAAAELASERARRLDPGRLGDAQLVAAVLGAAPCGSGIADGADGLPLAEDLLERFGGIRGLFGQHLDTLLATPALGEEQAAMLAAARELSRRAALAELGSAPLITGAKAARRFLAVELAGAGCEIFGLLLLNTRHYLLGVERMFRGTIDRAAVYPREVVKCCLRYNAAAAIAFHNHPSGIPEPTDGDRQLTRRLVAVLGEVDVRLIDHIVVGAGKQVSLAERDMM